MDKMETNDSSSDSENDENELETQAQELEKQLSDNKYLYDVHLKLVDLYRKLGDLTSMRAAYERFYNLYPLTAEIWLTWLQTEMKLANIPTEKINVLNLFEKAVEDYLSISLWLEYIQFAIGVLEADEVRTLINKGLTVGGLHCSQGVLLWDVLREFEITHLSLLEIKSKDWEKQLERVQDAFRRQLSVPLLEMENTYKEWKYWMEQLPEGVQLDPKPLEWGYQNALKKLEKYKPFEEKLLQCNQDEEILACYKDYIEISDDPSTTVCLYERAVAILSLNTELWTEYCYFCMKLGDVCNKVVKRSLRNCPWSEELWICSIRILEDQKNDKNEIQECLEQGLASVTPDPGLNLWLAYLEYVKRSKCTMDYLHKLFSQAVKQLGEGNDPTFIILRWQAKIYAKENKVKEFRKIWNEMLRNSTYKKLASAWLEYAALEREYGEAKQVKVLFQKALAVPVDWPQCIANEWLFFERENGTLQDVISCEKACKGYLKKQQFDVQVQKESHVKVEKRKRTDYFDQEQAMKAKKTRLIELRPKFNPTDFDTEKSIFLSNMRSDVTEDMIKEIFPNAQKLLIPKDRKGYSKCFAYVEFASHEEAEDALKKDREPINGRPLFVSKCRKQEEKLQEKKSFKYSDNLEKNKLFVRGLPFSYDKGKVEELFKPYGAKEVRLVTYRNGKSKGLAYVEFPDEDAAQKALKATNEMKLENSEISVAISAPPPKKNALSSDDKFEERGAGFRNARTRLKVPLVPAVLQKKILSTTTSSSSTNGADSNVNPSNSAVHKTNEDFRKMLLKN